MAAREFVRTLTVRSREEGAAEVARSLHSVADAQQRVTRVTEEGARVVDMTASKLASVERAWNGLNGRLEGNTSAYRNFIRESNAAKQALDAGLTSVDRYKDVIRQLRDELQAAGTTRLGFNVDQSGINALLGVRAKLASSARDSASVFEDEIRLMDGLQVKASRLRAELDPLGAAYERMNAQIADYQQMADRQVITQGELAQATARSRQAFDEAASSLKPVNDNVKLTAGQVQNLGYQLNDTVTMLAMGASPFSIIASQGGQVVQALGDGPQGVRGSLAAIGTSILGLLTPTNLLIAGFAALAAGAVYFAMRGREKVAPLTDAMAAHRDAISAVSDAYGAAASKAAEFQKASSGVAAFNVRQSRAQLELSARASLNDNFKPGLLTDLFGSPVYQQGLGDNGKVITEVTKQFAAFEKPVLALVEGLEKGKARADLFVDAVAEIANLQPANKELQEAAKKLIDLAGAAAEAQRQMAGLGPAFAKAARDAKQFNDLASGLGQFIPDRQTDAQRIEQTYQQMMRLAKTEADITRAQDLRRLSLEGLAEVETRRRAGYELDVRAVTAKSAAERAQIEYERTYADVLASTNDAAQAARQGQEARDLSLKQSQHDLAEAMNERVRAGQQQVDQLQQEIDTFGKSAGEVARLTTETQLLTAAREAARQAGEVVDPAEEAKIREQAAAIGELTDRMTRLNLGRDQQEQMRQLQAEAGLIGLNDDARRVALAGLEAEAELRRQGIPLNDAWGQSYVANARQIASMDVALDKQSDAFEGVRDAARGFFETITSGGSVLDALASTFGRLGQQLASKGFDRIFGRIFGGGDQGASGLAATGSAIAQTLNRASAYVGSSDQTYAAPLGAVTRAPLGPIEVSLPQSSSRTVERAGNAFLGLIRQAEGTAGANGYNTSLAYGRFTGGERNLTGMTLGQIDQLQTAMLRHPDNTYNSSALGAYQIVRTTLRELKAQNALPDSTLFSPELQDKFALQLASRRGASVSGLRSEWEGFRRVDADTILAAYNARGSDVTAARAYERATERGVERGVSNALPSIDGGYAGYGRSGGVPIPTSRPNVGGLTGSGSILGIDYPAFSALGGISAGLGGFGAGYSSGSVLGGGLQGALGGFMAGGPIGAVIGGLAGVLGGGLGGRKQRQEAHKQAAAKWAEMQPQYEAFDRSLSGEKQGDLRAYIEDGWSKLSGFMSVGGAAWKMGTGNSTAQFNSTGKKLFEGFLKMLGDFRDGFDSMITDMSSGQGLQGAFAKGRNATKELADQIKKTRDDVDIAFGNIASIDFLNTPGAQAQAEETAKSRADAIARYNDAAAKYALSLLYSAEKFSDVQQTIDGLRGTAAGLVPIFADLGWNADEAAKAINDRLSAAIANIARELEQTLADRIDDLNGKGYFATVRDFLDEYAGLQRDFAAAGADGSRLPEFFKLQAQEIVNGAELTGDAFAELIRLFPDLSGVVVEAGKAVGASTAEIADAIKGYEERLFDAQNGSNELARIERKLAADRIEAAKFGADALAMFEKAAAAERANAALSDARNVLDRSYQAETDRINDLLSARRDEASELESTISKLEDFRDSIAEFKRSLLVDDSLSTLAPEARLAEARKQFLDLAAKAQAGDADAQSQLTGAGQEYLTEARSFYASSERYHDAFAEVRRILDQSESYAQGQLTTAQSQLAAVKQQIGLAEAQLSVAKAQYDAILGAREDLKSFQVALAEMAVAIAQSRNAGVTTPGNTGATTPVGSRDLTYLANNPDVAKAIAAGQTFGVTSGNINDIIQAHWQQWGQNEVGKGTRVGYSSGGFTGMGGVNDVAGVVHGQEYVMDAATTRSLGVPTLDMMRQTRSLPTIAMPASPRMMSGGNDNGALLAEMRAMKDELRALKAVSAAGSMAVKGAVEDGNDLQSESNAIAKRDRMRSAA